MNISAMSIYMNQASLQNTASISVLKMAMNSSTETSTQMNDMISNMAVDPSIGKLIDATV